MRWMQSEWICSDPRLDRAEYESMLRRLLITEVVAATATRLAAGCGADIAQRER